MNRTIGEQATYWEIDVPAEFVAEFNRITFGKHRQIVNVWQWDMVRRAFRESWPWVASWVRAGYPEPPTWIVLQAMKEQGGTELIFLLASDDVQILKPKSTPGCPQYC